MKSETAALGSTFTVHLSSTRRGARLARKLAVAQLDLWGAPPASPVSEAAAVITAELAANAIAHGRTPGRDFGLYLTRTTDALRIAVADTRPDRLPPRPGSLDLPSPEASGGRGLLLVHALAARWGCTVRDAIVKVVWAELPFRQE